MPEPIHVCYVCSTPCSRLIEVDRGIYVYLCKGACEARFWDVIADMLVNKEAS